jgi:hypothetical protein
MDVVHIFVSRRCLATDLYAKYSGNGRSHYLSFVRTVVNRFSEVPIWSERFFTRALSSEISLDCCWGKERERE